MPRKQSAGLSADELRAAIPRLKLRIADLRAVDFSRVLQEDDPFMGALEQKVNATLAEIFGNESTEYERFGDIRLNANYKTIRRHAPANYVQRGFAQGVKQAIASLECIIELFEERLGSDYDDIPARARRTFAQLDLHPEIAHAVTRLFEDGHYANAVEDACKVLDRLVKLRSNRYDLSGTELMQAVFSPKNPTLRLNQLQSDSDRSEQQGFMFLYAGAMLALRNPRAHELIQDNAETAIEYIAFLNLLARTLDRVLQ